MISKLEYSKASQPLTNWRAKDNHNQQAGIAARHHTPLTVWSAKDRHDQQARIAARHYSHSLPGEPRRDMIRRLELQHGTTAFQPLTSWRTKDKHDQQPRVAARHHSHSQTGEPRIA